MNEKITSKERKKDEVAIKVENLSKAFKIPHEKETSLKGAALKLLQKKSYEKFEALKDVSFEVKKGEFFGIIGRNGSGKSTLLKILAGIYVPDSGKVTINGKLSPFLELGVGFNPELSGRENLFLGGAILGLTRQEVTEKFDKIVQFAELEEFIDMKLKNYSSGMQVRLAFSLAINVHAEILLMDEVLAVGDTNFQNKCLEEFNKYRESGKTVILVSHDTFTIQKYCDRAMLLRNGTVELVGRASDVTSLYISENVADEERRLNQKLSGKFEVNSTGKTISTCIARVERVTVLENGKETKLTKNKSLITIRLNVNVFETLNNPIFGIIISDVYNDRPIFVTNTDFRKIFTGKVHGKITIDFKFVNEFASGEYYISPAIANRDAKIYYDWKDKMVKFRVINKSYKSGGIVDLSHEILIRRR